MSGKGAIACTHPLSAGLFGRYSRIANDLVAASDALIVVGCKLGEIHATASADSPGALIHIDILARRSAAPRPTWRWSPTQSLRCRPRGRAP